MVGGGRVFIYFNGLGFGKRKNLGGRDSCDAQPQIIRLGDTNRQPRLSPVDVELFAKTYVSLRRLSRETQIGKNTLGQKLSDQGCLPIVDPTELGVELYRRRDLPPGIYGLM